MNISLFYQLRERLCAVAISGCDVIGEDFRLKRAVEEFEPLAKANKVFAKLYAMCGELLTSSKPALLADCIALCDALAVTQGTFRDNSETAENTGVADCEPSDIHYSMLFNSTESFRSKDPRVINDYLGKLKENTSGYAKMLAEQFTINCGRGLVPVLKQRVDLTNPKENGTIVKWVGKIAGADENDWYLSLIDKEDNPQAVRSEAVANLVYDESNAERLLELYKTEKAKIKDSAGMALVRLNVPECEVVLKKITSGKFARKNAELISISQNKIAVDFAVDYAEKWFEQEKSNSKIIKYDYDLVVPMLANKADVEDILYNLRAERLNINSMLIQNLAGNKDEKFRVLIENLYRRNSECFAFAYFVMNAFENRGVKIADLPETADSHRDDFLRRFENVEYNDVKNCYMCEGNTIDDGRIYDILEFVTDTSYLAKASILLALNKKKEEERFRDICSELACRAVNKIFESSAEQDRDRISEYRLDFLKAVMNARPNVIAFYVLCKNEPQYITENPHLFEDLIMYHLDKCWIYITNDVPAGIINTAVIPVYKKLKKRETLKGGKYPSGNVHRQIKFIESYLQDNGYDVSAV